MNKKETIRLLDKGWKKFYKELITKVDSNFEDRTRYEIDKEKECRTYTATLGLCILDIYGFDIIPSNKKDLEKYIKCQNLQHLISFENLLEDLLENTKRLENDIERDIKGGE